MRNVGQKLIAASLILFLAGPTWSKDKASESSAPPADAQKLDIEDLEKKYWTPKDTKYNVVQNRTYGKEGKFALSLQGGLLVNDNFNEGFSFNGALNYYFNENHGVELNYFLTSLQDSEATTVFKERLGSGVAPDFNRIQNYVGVNYNFIPFYAKVSVMGWKILYFDFSISPGVGLVTYEQLTEADTFNENLNTVAFNLDITQQFFFSKSFAIRMDLRNLWYKEKVLKFGGTVTKEERDPRNSHTVFFNLGLQYFF